MDFCHDLTKLVITHLGKNVKSASQYPTFRHGHGVSKEKIGYAKDLTGFIDGTRNPDHLLRAVVDQAIIFPDDEQGSTQHSGGSYMYAGRFVHNLPKVRQSVILSEFIQFFGLSDEQKSSLVGRDYTKMTPHVGYDQRPENPHLDPLPSDSHVARSHASIMRHAMPYRNLEEEGLYFIAFARSLVELDSSLKRMAGHFADDGSPDRLLSITKAVTSNYYYTPSLSELSYLALQSDIKIGKQEATTLEKAETHFALTDVKKERGKVKVMIEYCTNCGYKVRA
jgi:Dyp-type peroxidase family